MDHRQLRPDRRPLHIVQPEQPRHGSSPAVWQGESSRRTHVNRVQALGRQAFLLPPDMQDWVPQDDIVHLVLDAVSLMDLSKYEEEHRVGGVGRARATR